MLYDIYDIERDVRVALDMNASSEPLIEVADTDTLALDEIIRSQITKAVRMTVLNAPFHLLNGGKQLPREIQWIREGCGRIILPDDFMRLVVFKMSDWDMPVFEVITADDPLYAVQHSRFKCIRGNAQRPVCAVVGCPEGSALEFFSSYKDIPHIIQGAYIPIPKIEADGIEIPQRCYDATIYCAASLVSATIGENDKATALMELSKSLLA